MKRLTTNKPVTEMSMWELAHNSCYVKDGKARYRDYSLDMDARELTRNLLNNLADDAFIDNSDETFDDVIADYLQYGTGELVSLIALFYRNLWAMADLRECLKKYEDREEGCEPKYLGENIAIGCRNGECKCGNIVKSYQKYCDECGIKLEWGNVRAQ